MLRQDVVLSHGKGVTMKLKNTGLLPKKKDVPKPVKQGLEVDYQERDNVIGFNQAIDLCGEIEVPERLDERKVAEELQLRYFKLMYPDITESDAEIVASVLAKTICSQFAAPQIDEVEIHRILSKIYDKQPKFLTDYLMLEAQAKAIVKALEAK